VIVTGDGTGSSTDVSTPAQAGFVGIGTGGFYPAQFDDFNIRTMSLHLLLSANLLFFSAFP